MNVEPNIQVKCLENSNDALRNTNSFIYDKPEKSNFAAHLLNNHYPLSHNCFNTVQIINDKKLIDTWEELEIFKSYQTGNSLNEQLPNFNNPLFNSLYKIIK